jgi:hypothetical protein
VAPSRGFLYRAGIERLFAQFDASNFDFRDIENVIDEFQ